MAVVSISSASNSITATRLFLTFLFLCTLILTREYWLPASTASPSWHTKIEFPKDSQPSDLLYDTTPQDTTKAVEGDATPASALDDSHGTTDVKPEQRDDCYYVEGAQSVMVVLKTGATEVSQDFDSLTAMRS